MAKYYINNYYRINVRDYTDFALSGDEFCNSSICTTDILSKVSPDVINKSIVEYDIQRFNTDNGTDLTIKNLKETKTNDTYDYDIYQRNGNTYIGWGRVKITDTIEAI